MAGRFLATVNSSRTAQGKRETSFLSHACSFGFVHILPRRVDAPYRCEDSPAAIPHVLAPRGDGILRCNVGSVNTIVGDTRDVVPC
eukprot:765791-Hanusia_phi.AAC.5